MKILPINNFYQKYHFVQKPEFKTFNETKYDTVCFRSNNLLDLPKQEIFEKIEESLHSENLLGRGTEAEVYKINNYNYCVKIPYESVKKYNTSFSKQLSPKDKVNHVVAKLDNGAAIMEYFEGVIPDLYKNNKDSWYELQTEIANMPIKSYSDFLHQIANAINNEMIYDCSGGNLIINIKEKKLTPIDFYNITDKLHYPKPLTEMYHILTYFGAEKTTGKKIFDKIVSAAMKEFNPYIIPCMDITLFDFEPLCFKRCHDNYTKNHNKVVNEIFLQTQILKELKKKEIADKPVIPVLQENIRKSKRLLKKIH